MDNPRITYVVHIAATPEELWVALTSPDALMKNWGRIESKWSVGSKVSEIDGSGKVLWEGEVVRREPPRLLSFTFDVVGSGEPPTEVTFELSAPASKVAPNALVVRLTVTQMGFHENSKVFTECARAWPEILSSVKTYLETGRPLGFVWNH
jgi:uncharacterized protein YndB with AHSA1/START domain